MRIGFQAGTLNERGMSVALHDYAIGAQEHLGHEAVVFYSPAKSTPSVVEKFGRSLRLVPVPPGDDPRRVSEPLRLDFCYYIREGRLGPLDIAARRSGVHAVFRHFEPHGDVYAYVSDWLADWMSGGKAPAVPHMVTLPKPDGDLRERLGIPRDAFVVGRYGGFDQFNLPLAHEAVGEALARRPDLHFLFVNTEEFIDHDRALFLPPIVDGFLSAWPDARLSLHGGVINTLIPGLEAGEYDLVCASLDFPNKADIIKEPIVDLKHVVIAAEDHPLTRAAIADPDALASYPWITLAEDHVGTGRIWSYFAAHGCTPPKIAETIEPDRKLVPAYAEAYALYRALYPAIKGAQK